MSLRTWLLAASLSLGACAPGARAPSHPRDAAPDPIVAAPEPAPDRAKLRAALAARRAVTVDRFLAYREARVYPVNSFQPGLAHVWIDAQGNLCAAATIIAADWGRDATVAAVQGDNFIALAAVDDGPLADWILTSGLTHHEIVAIQEPGFMGRFEEPEPDRIAEVERLYTVYLSVERQLTTMADASLDAATDALLAHPDLARRFLDGELAAPVTPSSDAPSAALGFAQPPA